MTEGHGRGLAGRRKAAQTAAYFLKWLLLGLAVGALGGLVGCLFSWVLRTVTQWREANGWMLFLLPAAGLVIVAAYRLAGQEHSKGSNGILEALTQDSPIPLSTGPLIFLSTALTHLAGGSAGREGAALQLGGSLGEGVGKLLRLDKSDRVTAVMCGMSAVFGALFGTPLAAAVFVLEVASVGRIYYAALLPCLAASGVGATLSAAFGLSEMHFAVAFPDLSWTSAGAALVLGVACGLGSMGFCETLHFADKCYKKFFPNPWVRILAAAALCVGLTLLIGNRDYNGGSMVLLEQSLDGQVRPAAFLLKLLLTAVTLGGGFKGGEIVPTLCVGATLGALLGSLFGLPAFGAALGMIALFAGVTNCPLASLFLAAEMFGGGGLLFFALAVAVSFALSGYFSLYASQRFFSSKLRSETLPEHTEE